MHEYYEHGRSIERSLLGLAASDDRLLMPHKPFLEKAARLFAYLAVRPVQIAPNGLPERSDYRLALEQKAREVDPEEITRAVLYGMPDRLLELESRILACNGFPAIQEAGERELTVNGTLPHQRGLWVHYVCEGVEADENALEHKLAAKWSLGTWSIDRIRLRSYKGSVLRLDHVKAESYGTLYGTDRRAWNMTATQEGYERHAAA